MGSFVWAKESKGGGIAEMSDVVGQDAAST